VLQGVAKIPRDSALFTPFRKAYRAIFEAHFHDHRWLTADYVTNNGPKRQVTIAGPHGLFSLALNRTMHPEGCNLVMFVDNNLAVFNPFVKMFAKWTGMLDLQGLKHSKVQQLMRCNQQDALVVAGGFVEAAVGTQEVNRVCRHMWPYWVKMCLLHGYELSFLWIYGATQVFNQSESGMQTRRGLAEKSMPAITPFGKFGLPVPKAPPLRVVNFRMELPHIKEPSKHEVEHWLAELERRVQATFKEHATPEGCAPVEPLDPWIHARL